MKKKAEAAKTAGKKNVKADNQKLTSYEEQETFTKPKLGNFLLIRYSTFVSVELLSTAHS